MNIFGLVQGHAVAIDPGVCFEFAVYFARTDAQFRVYALAFQQPPQGQRFFQAGGTMPEVADGCIDHTSGETATVPGSRWAGQILS